VTLQRAWSLLGQLFLLLLAVALVVYLAGRDTALAWLLLIGVGALVSARVIVAFVHYRRVMGREWPQVKPLDDDDW
jgi:Kef-type K+ transport system membrane component KefB